ncbi:hypothetical protein [Angustibacter aerolatus]
MPLGETTTADGARSKVARLWAQYETGADRAGADRPLGGYALLMGAYGAAVAALGVAARRRLSVVALSDALQLGYSAAQQEA